MKWRIPLVLLLAVAFAAPAFSQVTPPPVTPTAPAQQSTTLPPRPNMPLPRIPVPENAKGTAEDPTSLDPKSVESSPSARIMLDDAERLRRQAQIIEVEDFRRNGSKVFELTRDLIAAAQKPIDAQTEKSLRRKANDIDGRIANMIQFLSGRKPNKANRPNSEMTIPLPQSIAELARTLVALRPDLIKLNQQQGATLDLQLTRSVIQQLEAAQIIASRIKGR